MTEPTFADVCRLTADSKGVERWGTDAMCYWAHDGSRAVVHRGAPGTVVITGTDGKVSKVHYRIVRPIRAVVMVKEAGKTTMSFRNAVAGLFGEGWGVWNSIREARRDYRSMIASTLMTVLPAPMVVGVARALEAPDESKNKRRRVAGPCGPAASAAP